mgnify:FL=1
MPKRGMTAKMYTAHYTLLGRAVWHLCKLDVTQLRNLVTNITQLTKVKRTKKRKSTKKGDVRRTARRAYEPTAKQKRARKLFAMRAKRGDFR